MITDKETRYPDWPDIPKVLLLRLDEWIKSQAKGLGYSPALADSEVVRNQAILYGMQMALMFLATVHKSQRPQVSAEDTDNDTIRQPSARPSRGLHSERQRRETL